MTSILESLDIKHETTSSHMPQSNDKVERMNHTLNETVHAMLFQANMSESFWIEVMHTAVYVRNRLPSDAIDDDIPFERWFDKDLDSDELKIPKPFGCTVYIHVPKKRRKR